MIWYRLKNIYVTGYTGDIISEFREDNIPLTRAASVPAMTEGSYHHDLARKRLYVWAGDTSNPNANGKVYLIYVWLGFCSDRAEYGIQGEDERFYRPVIDAKSSPPLTEQVSAFFTGEVSYGFGGIKISDPRWLYENYSAYIWENARVRVKFGDTEGDYGAYSTIFSGNIIAITANDKGGNISVRDTRASLFSTLPPDRFPATYTPYFPQDNVGNPIPVLVGRKNNIAPALIHEQNNTYQVSQTSFSFGDFPLEEISAVYDGGSLISPGGYTVDLAAGTFTLASPPTGDVTCDAKGIKIGRNFAAETWTGGYTENPADITYVYLRMQKIAPEDIDESTFLDLQGAAGIFPCGDFLDSEIEFRSKLVELQSSGMFHLVSSAEGKINARIYSLQEAPVASIGNEYIASWQQSRALSGVYSRVNIRYGRQSAGQFQTTTGENVSDYSYFQTEISNFALKYKINSAKTLPTLAADATAAQNLSLRFAEISSRQPDLVDMRTNFDAINWPLLSTILISRKIGPEGDTFQPYDRQPFQIVGKSISWNGTVGLKLRSLPISSKGQVWTDQNGDAITDENGDAVTT